MFGKIKLMVSNIRVVVVPLLALLLTFSMFSCVTGSVWNKEVAADESAKIWFDGFEPTSYNGIDVDKKKFRIITLPAGKADFTGDIAAVYYEGNTKHIARVKDVSISLNFESGEEYWTTVRIYEGRWSIVVYKTKIQVRVGYPSDDRIVTIIPLQRREDTPIKLQ